MNGLSSKGSSKSYFPLSPVKTKARKMNSTELLNLYEFSLQFKKEGQDE